MEKRIKKVLNAINVLKQKIDQNTDAFLVNNDVDSNLGWLVFNKNFEPFFVKPKRIAKIEYYIMYFYHVNKQIPLFEDVNLVGHISFVASKQKNDNAKMANLDMIEILPYDFVNTGLGSKMHEMFEFFAHEKGVNEVNAYAKTINNKRVSNQNLIDFYTRKGYEIVKKHDNNEALLNLKIDHEKQQETKSGIVNINYKNVTINVCVNSHLKPIIVEELNKLEKQK